jgi:hypothetical protein
MTRSPHTGQGALRHSLAVILLLAVALFGAVAANAGPGTAPASAATEGYVAYLGCGLAQDTKPAHACDLDEGAEFGAFFRSPVTTTYEVCVDFPGERHLCRPEQEAVAGTLYVNKITTDVGGALRLTWLVGGEEVAEWSFHVQVQAPVFGKTAAVSARSGRILIRDPKGGGFVPLEGEESAPMGTVIDARAGVVSLVAASGEGGTSSGRFHAGVFRLDQRKGRSPFHRGRVGLTVLTLTGRLPKCGAAVGSKAGHGGNGRHIWGDAHGDFQTGGRYAAATVGGTKWLTEDTCAGTRVAVARGVVSVADHRNHRTVLVTAHHSYLAAASGAHHRSRARVDRAATGQERSGIPS